MAMSLYALRKLYEFDDITQSILKTDNRVLDYEKKLADSLLSEIRYERKFIISKDEALYGEFLKFKADFDRYLTEVSAMAEPHAAAIFNQVKEDHERYQELFSKETMQLKNRQNYP